MKKIIVSSVILLFALLCFAAAGFAAGDENLTVNIEVAEPEGGAAATGIKVSDESDFAYAASAKEVFESISELTADMKNGFSVDTLKSDYYLASYSDAIGEEVALALWESPVCFAEKSGETYLPVKEFECGKTYTVFAVAVNPFDAVQFRCAQITKDFQSDAAGIASFKAYQDATDDYNMVYSKSYYSAEDRSLAKADRDEAYEAWKADAEGQAEYARLYAEFDKKINDIENSVSEYADFSFTINGNEAESPLPDGYVYSYEFAPASHVWNHSAEGNSVSVFCEECEEKHTVSAVIPQDCKCSAEPKEITADGALPEGFSVKIVYETPEGKAPSSAGEYKAYLELYAENGESPAERAALDLTIDHSLVKHAAVSPDCVKEGNEEYFTCEGCDYTTFKAVPALGHDYGEYKYNNDAGVNKNGTKTRVCNRCGEKETVTAEGTALNEAKLGIKNIDKYNGKTLKYKTTIKFSPAYADCSGVKWHVSGADGTVNADGSFTVKEAKADFSVYMTAMDLDGKEIKSETEEIKIKKDFFSRLIAFFVLLFNKDAYTIEQ